MSETSDLALLDAPAIAECGDRITEISLDRVRRLEMEWASPLTRCTDVTTFSPKPSLTALDTIPDDGLTHSRLSLANDEAPPFLQFDYVADSPVDSQLRCAPVVDELPHEPGRIVDYVAMNGERVIVDISDNYLGEGAVAKIYSGTLRLLLPGETETTNTRSTSVACRVQRLERWLTHLLWLPKRCRLWRHPCIIRYYMTTLHDRETLSEQCDTWNLNNVSVVSVFEKAEGGNLKDLISTKGNLTASEIRHVLHDILSALQYMHAESQIVHNDVKPGNILLCSNPCGSQRVGVRYKLSDFDCALPLEPLAHMESRLHAAQNDLPPSGQTGGGTTVYMAPEVSLGLCRFSASDVWSLGITAFNMATGSLPWRPMECQFPELITSGYRNKFVRGDLFQPASATTECEAAPNASVSGFGPDLSSIMSDMNCPPLLRDFICQCLVEDPRARPTCRQLLEHPFLCGDESLAQS